MQRAYPIPWRALCESACIGPPALVASRLVHRVRKRRCDPRLLSCHHLGPISVNLYHSGYGYLLKGHPRKGWPSWMPRDLSLDNASQHETALGWWAPASDSSPLSSATTLMSGTSPCWRAFARSDADESHVWLFLRVGWEGSVYDCRVNHVLNLCLRNHHGSILKSWELMQKFWLIR